MTNCITKNCKSSAVKEVFWPYWAEKQVFPYYRDKYPTPWIPYCNKHSRWAETTWGKPETRPIVPDSESESWDE